MTENVNMKKSWRMTLVEFLMPNDDCDESNNKETHDSGTVHTPVEATINAYTGVQNTLLLNLR